MGYSNSFFVADVNGQIMNVIHCCPFRFHRDLIVFFRNSKNFYCVPYTKDSISIIKSCTKRFYANVKTRVLLAIVSFSKWKSRRSSVLLSNNISFMVSRD